MSTKVQPSPTAPPAPPADPGNAVRAERKLARMIGWLFIAATAAASVSVVLLGEILDAPDLLRAVGGGEARVLLAVLADLVVVATVVGIPIALYPVLRRHGAAVARGYFAVRLLEGVVILAGAFSLLMLVTLGRESVEAAASISPGLPATALALDAAHDWTDLIGTQFVFGLSALILNWSLYQSRLIPRWISAWGFIGAVLVIGSGAASLLFGSDPFSMTAIALFLPIAVNEMVMAGWFIVRGFNASAIVSS